MGETFAVEVPRFISFTMGMAVFFLGAFLTRRAPILQNYNIPEPVTGGLAVAALTGLVFAFFNTEITFVLDVRDTLLVIFFATIGLNARFADLLAGGRMLALLFAITVGFIVIQNGVGYLGAIVFGLPSAVGVLLGSASLIGGHGTAIAWAPAVQADSGFAAATEVGTAAATLGLIFAAMTGGPIAKYLIDRNKLHSTSQGGPIVGLPYEYEETGDHQAHHDHTREHHDHQVNYINVMRAFLATNIAVIIGYFANLLIEDAGFKLPLFVTCLLAGIVMSNTVPLLFPKLPWPARTRALAIISDYSLSVFLAMSLMSLQLWTLAGLGGPLITVLAAQVAAAVLLIVFLVFRLLGSDYTAAVLCAGFAGFSLGATPTAIANMSSVTKHYGPAPLTFIMLPLVSAFLVDLANAVVIRFFVALP